MVVAVVGHITSDAPVTGDEQTDSQSSDIIEARRVRKLRTVVPLHINVSLDLDFHKVIPIQERSSPFCSTSPVKVASGAGITRRRNNICTGDLRSMPLCRTRLGACSAADLIFPSALVRCCRLPPLLPLKASLS